VSENRCCTFCDENNGMEVAELLQETSRTLGFGWNDFTLWNLLGPENPRYVDGLYDLNEDGRRRVLREELLLNWSDCGA
jgi:hypothetical protein